MLRAERRGDVPRQHDGPTVPMARPRCPTCGAWLRPLGKPVCERECACGLTLTFRAIGDGRAEVYGSGIGPHGLRRDKLVKEAMAS